MGDAMIPAALSPAVGPQIRQRTAAMLVYDWSSRLMGGSIRAINLAHGLPARGWDVLVLTATPPEEWPATTQGVDVHYIPSKERSFGGGISADTDGSRLDANPGWLRALSAVKRLLPLERQLVWYPGFWRQAPAVCAEYQVDVVVSVVAPNVMMPLGHALGRKLNVPHVIDLRDDFADRSQVEDISWAYQQVLNLYGGWATRNADGLTVVSSVTRNRFAKLGVDATLLMNGYVEGQFSDVEWTPQPVSQDGKLRMVHLGWLGDFRSIEPLTRAISVLPTQVRDAIRIEHYGLIDPAQHALLKDCACEVEVFEQVPHAEAIGIMREADVLLAIPGDHVPAAVTGKLFEYLRARRPILLLAGDGAARALAEQAGIGRVVHPGHHTEIVSELVALVAEKHAGTLKATSDADFIRGLARGNGAGILADLLDRVTP